MRLLLSAVPAFGHVLPLVPLARAACAAGHQVALLTSAGLADAVAHELPGVELLPAGPMPDALFAEVARRTGADALTGQDPAAVAEFFAGARVDLTADEALERAAEWKPDVVVAEAGDFVGPLVAASLGIPWHVLAFGPAVPEEFTASMFAVVGSRYASRGIVPTAPQSYLDPCPPSLQVPGWQAPVAHAPIRPEAHRQAEPLWVPPVFVGADYRVRVLVTLGTVFTRPDLLQAIIASLDLRSVSVVATLGVVPGGAEPVDTADVRYVSFVPMAELLPHADIVISAGGAGTVLAALEHKRPMVLIPQGADQPINAARAAAVGAAIVVADPADVGTAVQRIIMERSFGDASVRVADEIAAMPDAAHVVAGLIPVG